MLVSALFTSLGINSGLCVFFFVLYSILRKQPRYYQVFLPRLLAQGNSKRRRHFNLERLIPSTSWVKRAWSISEDDLISSSGLDAAVFIRMITFCLKVFSLAGIIGLFVLLPANTAGNQLEEIDFTNLSNNSLDVFTISNVKIGSKSLWIHFSAVYIVTGFVCYLLYYEYKYISSKRIAYFCSSKPQPHQFTILVRSIPISVGNSISDSVESFFKEYYPSTYLSHVVVHRTSKLRNLIGDAKRLYKSLIHLQSDPTRLKDKHVGLFGRKADLADRHVRKLEDIEKNVRLEQSEVSLGREETRAAFVSFKSRYGAAIAFHLQQSINPTQWITEQAPEPHDVYWPFFSSSFMRKWISKLVVVVACSLLTVLFLIPVVVVQGLTNLTQLEMLFPFLKILVTIKFVRQVITGYLPNLILLLFLKTVPPIMRFLSSIQGYISHSEIEKSACNKVLWFTIWNIFFATLFSGSFFYQLSIILELKNIPAKLAVAVPAQASFFIAYVVTSGWTSAASEVVRVIPLIRSLVCTNDDLEVPSIPYYRDIPRILFFGLLGTTYFFLAPLILPFLLIYFCFAYTIFRNQFLNVYAPKYETAGKFWPIVHNSMIFSLVLMHAIAVGIFTLKKLSLASTLIFPLPVLTLLFNEYCRKRFLPIFVAYSAEVLIKKDREEQNDPAMVGFFEELITAYKDPALLPIQYSTYTDSLNTPLMSSAV
ncbi:CSC1-like protein [Tripterygium wilfordii]|uniref:CSC1-like protein n=1 Tax=Tripterygium wilfordii TaxID=458696 RepID=A0A7J7DGS3_TRIWF|nr:CSC1-like protein At1g69450 [Tripterygium wilfordii]XP_038705810.1 CSC1-like protein At1g69450 [Tripterygium wilfordii]KAF5745478.1 CSC1-like protein [Tripterygium wilfordii]